MFASSAGLLACPLHEGTNALKALLALERLGGEEEAFKILNAELKGVPAAKT